MPFITLIMPHLCSCYRACNMYHIACLLTRLYLSDITLSLNSEIQILCIRKILKAGSTKTHKKKHELYHKFDEDHEYVVIFNVE
jgi:hypothetical protein